MANFDDSCSPYRSSCENSSSRVTLAPRAAAPHRFLDAAEAFGTPYNHLRYRYPETWRRLSRSTSERRRTATPSLASRPGIRAAREHLDGAPEAPNRLVGRRPPAARSRPDRSCEVGPHHQAKRHSTLAKNIGVSDIAEGRKNRAEENASYVELPSLENLDAFARRVYCCLPFLLVTIVPFFAAFYALIPEADPSSCQRWASTVPWWVFLVGAGGWWLALLLRFPVILGSKAALKNNSNAQSLLQTITVLISGPAEVQHPNSFAVVELGCAVDVARKECYNHLQPTGFVVISIYKRLTSDYGTHGHPMFEVPKSWIDRDREAIRIAFIFAFGWSLKVPHIFALGLGWTSLELLFTLVQCLATIQLLRGVQQGDAKAVEAFQVLAAQTGRSDPLSVDPFWGVLERCSAHLIHIAMCLGSRVQSGVR
ncbi:Uncharacterized protein SCF082_LOCUS40088, partial [Durusdinium trenchii]